MTFHTAACLLQRPQAAVHAMSRSHLAFRWTNRSFKNEEANGVTPEWKKLQAELQTAAFALLMEAGASALALSLEEDRDGYWIAVGPRTQIPFLLGQVDNGPAANELMHASIDVARPIETVFEEH